MSKKIDPDGKFHDPEGYNIVRGFSIIGPIIFLIMGFILFTFISEKNQILALIIFAILLVMYGLIFSMFRSGHETEVSRSKFQHGQDQVKRAQEISDGIKEIEKGIDEMEKSAINTGKIIVSGKNAAVVIGPGIITYINDKEIKDPQLKEALTVISGHIENTRSREAAKYLNEFIEVIKQTNPNKTIIKSLWNSVIDAAPTVKHLTDSVATIVKLFV